MKRVQFFRNHPNLIIALSVLFFYSATFVLATPPGSPYAPGATLDPSCAPGDTNCSVAAASATWSSITGTLADQTDLQAALDDKYDISNPDGYITDIASFTADDLAEGATNLYFTDGRAQSALSGLYEVPLTFSGPLSRSTNTISIQDAAADSSTKGAATFTAADFNASSGLISLDYTNGQAASGSTKGFLTSADWTTFNGKQGALTLTTTGSSGAATLIGNTLNIPQYSGGTTYTFSTGLTESAGTVTNNLSTGISGGQSVIGGTGSGDNLTLTTTSNGTKGKIIFGTASAYDQVNDRFGITNTSPSAKLHIITAGLGVTQAETSGIMLQNTTAATSGLQQMSPALILAGNGWKTNATAASQDVRWKVDVLPASNSANPTSTLQFGSSINGAAYTLPFTVSSAGAGTFAAGVTANGTINASGSGISGFTYTSTGGTGSAVNVFNMTNSLTAAAGTTTGINMSALSYGPTSGTGVFNAFNLSPIINQTGGANGITRALYIAPTLTSAADFRAIELASADYGNGNAALSITIGRNTNATNTGAGSINFLSKGGTNGYVWQDNAGNLRIHTAAPSNANDTAGTVIGAQTSTRDTKQDIADYTDYNDALAKVVNAPLRMFRYIREVQGYGSDSPLAKVHLGFIADEVDPLFMAGNVIDQVSVNGLLIGSVKALDIKLRALPILEDQTLTSKIADFLRGIAESGTALVDNLKSKKVQTQELCVGDDSDQVCLTKDQLRNLLGTQGSASVSGPVMTTPEPTPETPAESTPEEESEEVTPEPETTPTPQPEPIGETPAPETSAPAAESAPVQTPTAE